MPPLLHVNGEEVDGSHLEIHHLLVPGILGRILVPTAGAPTRILDQLLRELGCLGVVSRHSKLLLLFFVIHEEKVSDPVLRDHNVLLQFSTRVNKSANEA